MLLGESSPALKPEGSKRFWRHSVGTVEPDRRCFFCPPSGSDSTGARRRTMGRRRNRPPDSSSSRCQIVRVADLVQSDRSRKAVSPVLRIPPPVSWISSYATSTSPHQFRPGRIHIGRHMRLRVRWIEVMEPNQLEFLSSLCPRRDTSCARPYLRAISATWAQKLQSQSDPR